MQESVFVFTVVLGMTEKGIPGRHKNNRLGKNE